MPIPSFEAVMLPLLTLSRDGQEHTPLQAIDELAYHFHLTEEERQELLPSGRRRRFDSRVHWATVYLSQAGLLEHPRRGTFAITDRGRNTLAQDPPRIDVRFLKQFPEFLSFYAGHRQPRPTSDIVSQNDEPVDTPSPEEEMATAHLQMRKALKAEILEQIMASAPAFFEQLVVDLLLAMGYGGSRVDAGRAIGKAGDGGIDGIINEDPLGLDTIYIQAKRWSAKVGAKEIRDFIGALELNHAHKGVFITTSDFAGPAWQAASNAGAKKIVLVNGERLAQLMIDHNVGVATTQTYELKRIDSDYFAEE